MWRQPISISLREAFLLASAQDFNVLFLFPTCLQKGIAMAVGIEILISSGLNKETFSFSNRMYEKIQVIPRTFRKGKLNFYTIQTKKVNFSLENAEMQIIQKTLLIYLLFEID